MLDRSRPRTHSPRIERGGPTSPAPAAWQLPSRRSHRILPYPPPRV
jgi:hypothetical protein